METGKADREVMPQPTDIAGSRLERWGRNPVCFFEQFSCAKLMRM
jgi:hypothetical protein